MSSFGRSRLAQSWPNFAQKTGILLAAFVFLLLQAGFLVGQAFAEETPKPEDTVECFVTEFQQGRSTQTTETCIVVIDCEVVGVWASRELSNIIVKYSDNTYDKYESDEFEGANEWNVPQIDGKYIVGLWIHAGNNHLGTDPDPAEYNSGNSVGRYHEVSVPQDCGEVIGEETCSVNVFSDTTNKVVEKANAQAKALSFIHPAWTANLPGATWIWGDDPVADPTNQTIQTFKKTFSWNGPVTDAVLTIAADNDFEVKLNGNVVGSDYSGWSFQSPKLFNVTSYIDGDAINTLEIKVINWEWPTVEATVNPAGLLYKLVVQGTDEDCGAEIPAPPASTLVANKIICDEESDLPNWGGGAPDITSANFAANWVANNQGCSLADDWSFQYRLSGDSSEPSGSYVGELGGWTTFTASGQTAVENVVLEGSTTIQVREVLPEGYIPFTGWTSQDNVSAEFYCHTDVANYDNWEWITNPQDGATYYCVAWNVPKNETFTLQATKIVCDDESYLPNWGNGNGPVSVITADTANQWLAEDDNDEHCAKTPWDFQWAPDTGNPGDETELAGSPWTKFSSGTINISTKDAGSKLWIREVFDENYIPFTGQNTTEDVSAEIYCHDDVLNYDNWEFISEPQADETYYCVAWNVELTGQVQGLIFNDENADSIQDPKEEPLEDWTVWLLTKNSPYTIRAIQTTDENGEYLFEDLKLPGTYYVCQGVQEGWFQTLLNDAGVGGLEADSLGVGSIIDGDEEVLDDLISTFCYKVELDYANRVASDKDFGNAKQEEETPGGSVLGESTDTPNGGGGGQVQGASTLANTGQEIMFAIVAAGLIASGAAVTTVIARRTSN